MAVFSDEEITKIRAKAKPESDLPIVYDKTTIPISKIYEAHLILSDDKIKREAIEWIDKAISIVKESGSDRDDLFNEFITNLSGDNDQQIRELEQELQGFQTFRNAFTASAKVDAKEMGWLFEDIYSAFGYYESQRSVQNHLNALLNSIKAKTEGAL